MIQTIIVTSAAEVCRWFNKTNVVIVGMKTVKGIANEDVVKISYVHKIEES